MTGIEYYCEQTDQKYSFTDVLKFFDERVTQNHSCYVTMKYSPKNGITIAYMSKLYKFTEV